MNININNIGSYLDVLAIIIAIVGILVPSAFFVFTLLLLRRRKMRNKREEMEIREFLHKFREKYFAETPHKNGN